MLGVAAAATAAFFFFFFFAGGCGVLRKKDLAASMWPYFGLGSAVFLRSRLGKPGAHPALALLTWVRFMPSR